MNDERLIQLLRETPPEDLSGDEIRELRRRLPQSGELRQVLFEHLQLDQALSETLGGLSLSPESITRRAATVTARGAGRLFGWGTISAVLLGLLGVAVIVAARWDRQPRPIAARAVVGSERNSVRAPALKRPSSSETRPPAIQTPPATTAEASDQEEQPSMAAVELQSGDEPTTAINQPENEPPKGVPRWFEPLIDVHNEAYNAVAELAVALRHREWRDACRVIVATRPEDMNGLAPDPSDADRLTTMQAMIGQAMHEHAELRQALEEKYGAAAWQRFRQAADEDEAAGVDAVAIGLPGTAAAGEALRWLGDRALAAGRFRLALAHYRAATRGAADGANVSLAARVRLAGAMLGQDLGSPPEESLEFDGQQLSPAEFEQLAAEMRSRGPAVTNCVEPLAPPPGNYTARVAARFDDGGPPVPEVTRPIRLARAASGVIVNSGYSVAAFDPADGNRRWLFSLAEAGRAPAWPAEPMNPLVIGSAVYVRLIGAVGPELVCLSVDTGKPLWKDRSMPRVACGPPLIDDRLIICQWHDDVAGRRRIDLATLDIATGRVNERLRLAWLSENAPFARCTLKVVEDSLVFATGDVLIATDLWGRPRWARRIHARDAPPTGANSAELPWIGPGAGCVYCYQPVEGNLQRIELSTGREHWRRVIGPAQRIIAVGTEQLAVQTDDGVDVYDVKSGETRCHLTAAAHAVVAAALSEQPVVVLIESIPADVPRLSWFDLTSGQQKGESVLEGLSPGPGSLTPCTTGNTAFWLARRGPAANSVELIELHAK